jgi:hypothetical protein
MPAGRPVEYTTERIQEIIDLLVEYTESADIPILAEFCYLNRIRRSAMYEHEELSYALGQCLLKKEWKLEKEALAGTIPVQMAKFSLAQMGWSDKQEIDHTTKGQAINVCFGDENLRDA